MNPLLDNENLDLGTLFCHYEQRMKKEQRDIERVKKLYHDDESFNTLMNRIIEKDYLRFQKYLNIYINKPKDMKHFATPWNMFGVILNIVLEDGEEGESCDPYSEMFTHKTLIYRGWTFSWVHKVGSLIVISNPQKEIVYQF